MARPSMVGLWFSFVLGVGIGVGVTIPATAQLPYRQRCHPDLIAAARDLGMAPEPAHLVVYGGQVCVVARR